VNRAGTWVNYTVELGGGEELETVSGVTEPCFWSGEVRHIQNGCLASMKLGIFTVPEKDACPDRMKSLCTPRGEK
jgi:hypothetical protein